MSDSTRQSHLFCRLREITARRLIVEFVGHLDSPCRGETFAGVPSSLQGCLNASRPQAAQIEAHTVSQDARQTRRTNQPHARSGSREIRFLHATCCTARTFAATTHQPTHTWASRRAIASSGVRGDGNDFASILPPEGTRPPSPVLRSV